MDFWTFYYSGGWFMHPIVLLGLCSAVSGLLALVVRRRWAVILALTCAALCLALGLLAYLLGTVMALNTLQAVAPEQYDAALASAQATNRIPLYFGAACALPGLIGGLIARITARRERTGV